MRACTSAAHLLHTADAMHVVLQLGTYRPSDDVIAQFQLREWEALESNNRAWSQAEAAGHGGPD